MNNCFERDHWNKSDGEKRTLCLTDMESTTVHVHGSDHEGDSKIPRTLATWGVATPMGFEHTLHYVIFVGFFFGFFCWQDMVLKLGVGWVGIAILPVNW